MPSLKADVKIRIEANGQVFTLNCIRGLSDQYIIKNGRTRSKIVPIDTLTGIFDKARRWAVKQESKN